MFENLNDRFWGCLTHEGKDLQNNDDHSDAGHESGHHGVGNIFDVGAQLENAEGNQEKTGQDENGDDGSKTVFKTARILNRCHHNQAGNYGHGTRRTADLGGRASEERGKQPQRNRPVQASDGAHSGLHSEGQGQRQGDNAGGNAAEQVTPEIGWVVFESLEQVSQYFH